MGCSFRVAFHDERFDDYAGEVSFTYSTASAFNDWLFVGIRITRRPRSERTAGPYALPRRVE